MGLGSEEKTFPETVEVKKGKHVVFGGREGLPRKLLEISLDENGNPRVKRLEGLNRVVVWGRDRQTFDWIDFKLKWDIPDKHYERISGGPIIIDIFAPTESDSTRLIRLNDAGGIMGDIKTFEIQVNPRRRDLTKRN